MPSFWEKLQVDGQEMSVYSSVPSGSGPFPAVLIAHPASGVGEFTQSIADRLAEAGFAAVAPDLFHRVTEDMTADGTAKNAFLKDAEIVADITLRWTGSVDILLLTVIASASPGFAWVVGWPGWRRLATPISRLWCPITPGISG